MLFVWCVFVCVPLFLHGVFVWRVCLVICVWCVLHGAFVCLYGVVLLLTIIMILMGCRYAVLIWCLVWCLVYCFKVALLCSTFLYGAVCMVFVVLYLLYGVCLYLLYGVCVCVFWLFGVLLCFVCFVWCCSMVFNLVFS